MLLSPVRSVSPPRPWKDVSAGEATYLIASGATVAVAWIGDHLAVAMAAAYQRRSEPADLTIVYSAIRNGGRSRGLNRLALPGLVRRVIGGQWQPVPGLQALARLEQIEAYSLPVGVIQRLFRDIADDRPGHVTRSGLGTSADPRHGGGRLNRSSQESLVRLVRLAGGEALLFRTFPIDVALIPVAFIAGADTVAATREGEIVARAARACGGMVIAQQHRIGTLERLPANMTVVPETMIDVLVAPAPDENLPDVSGLSFG